MPLADNSGESMKYKDKKGSVILLNTSAATDIGTREQNQDSYRIKTLDDKHAFLIVCDGMGGENAGEIASALTADEVTSRVVNNFSPELGTIAIKNLLTLAVTSSNTLVHSKSVTEDGYKGMGTTCVAVLVQEHIAHIVNVGDSRAYIIDEDGYTISQITHDHTYVEQLLQNGEISREDKSYKELGNYITKAIGVEPEIDVDYFEEELTKGSIILLCSDGLTGVCSDMEILDIINQNKENLQTAADSLIKRAIENGGKDNVTAALALI